MGTTIRRWNGTVLYESTQETIAKALLEAIEKGADLRGADLTDANLRRANLTGANLTDANLTGANLRGADLTDANLTGANLTDANLRRANLTDANLTDANLTDANLTGADLRGADLTDANLRRANLTGANLTGADLTGAEADLRRILDAAPHEVAGLRTALVEGRVDGSAYEGECACLIGTIANIRGCSYQALVSPELAPNAARPAERWFLAIRPGLTPDVWPPSKLTVEWIDRWIADHAAPTTEAVS